MPAAIKPTGPGEHAENAELRHSLSFSTCAGVSPSGFCAVGSGIIDVTIWYHANGN